MFDSALSHQVDRAGLGRCAYRVPGDQIISRAQHSSQACFHGSFSIGESFMIIAPRDGNRYLRCRCFLQKNRLQ